MGIKTNARGPVRGLCLAGALGLTLTTGLSWALVPPEDGSAGTGLRAKEFFLPELYVSSSQRHVDEVLAELPNRVAWENFQAAREQAGKGRLHAFIDPRSGTATNMIDAEPLIPGRGVGNQVTLAELGSRFGYKVHKVGPEEVANAVLDFVSRNRQLLGVDMNQLGDVRAVWINGELWHVNVPQTYHGIPVRHGRLAATLNNGNLVLIGTESWGKVRGLSHVPQLTGEDAMAIGFDYADGQSPIDEIVLGPTLEVVPVAPEPGAYRGRVGQGYDHRLVWSFQFRRPPEGASWEVLIDAHSGEVISFRDVNQYATITGGVYPVTSTEICPSPGTCGIMQTDWPMPWADTGLAAPNNYTNSGGVSTGSCSTTTTLSGLYVDMTDYCGTISNSGSPSIDLGGTNGDHNCTTGGGSAGNTAASRTAFYEVNKLMEMARGWLPGNTWLQSPLTTRVNINNTCNAYYSGNTINFYRSGGGCRNTGELAGVFDHEWGHGLDYHDANMAISNPGEAYADIAEIYRLQTSCVGHGFWWTSNKGCGMTADGTGYNQDEDQTAGYHCDLDCSGVRDADWDKHADHTPDTPLNFVCSACNYGGAPCGRQVHCAAAPSRQAAWDFVTRDLQSPPFNLDNQTAFIIGNKVFYQGSGNVGAWHACTCGISSDGCGATHGYMQWLAADDDDGNISNGTPHMTALYNAFNRHEIACATPTPTNSGCAAAPTGTATLSVVDEGNNRIDLSWTAVAGASKYWVFRTEGHAGCDYNKVLIAETTGLSYTDCEVANSREYYYNVVAVGSSDACFGPVSNCVPASPIPSPLIEVNCSDDLDNDCDGYTDGADSDCCAPTEDPEETCSDDLDNDCDTLTDGADPDCCVPSEPSEVSCSDGLDNDCDGLIDGADPHCSVCVPSEPSEVSCSDGLDNDCDGYRDVSDSDCPSSCPPGSIDFNTYGLTSYAHQNFDDNYNVLDGGDTLQLLDNTWLRSTINYAASAPTNIHFEFASESQGQIHAIGLDENNRLNDAPRHFHLWGTQYWTGTGKAADWSPQYSGSAAFETFSIRVGDYYTGGPMSLVFTNDNDAGSGNEGKFRCVRVCTDNFVLYETFDDNTSPFSKESSWDERGTMRINPECETLESFCYCNSGDPPFYVTLEEGECTYHTGDIVTGELISPEITGISTNSTLSFSYLREVEDYAAAPYDKTEVAVAEANTNSWTTVWSRDSRDESEATWTESTGINLKEWAGKNIQIRFHFDSVDSLYNDYKGWWIDNVKVTGQSPCEPYSGSNTLPAVTINPLVGGPLFTEGEEVTFTGTAIDAEDGDKTSALQWASNRDGLIAQSTGSFSTSSLSLGNHIITAWVTDSSNAIGSDSVSITIERAIGVRSRSRAQPRTTSPSTGPAPLTGPSRSAGAASIIPR